jgi:hypothetical protein
MPNYPSPTSATLDLVLLSVANYNSVAEATTHLGILNKFTPCRHTGTLTIVTIHHHSYYAW